VKTRQPHFERTAAEILRSNYGNELDLACLLLAAVRSLGTRPRPAVSASPEVCGSFATTQPFARTVAC